MPWGFFMNAYLEDPHRVLAAPGRLGTPVGWGQSLLLRGFLKLKRGKPLRQVGGSRLGATLQNRPKAGYSRPLTPIGQQHCTKAQRYASIGCYAFPPDLGAVRKDRRSCASTVAIAAPCISCHFSRQNRA